MSTIPDLLANPATEILVDAYTGRSRLLESSLGDCRLTLHSNDPAAPYCRTQTNPLSSQYNHYCDAVGGTVTATAGAQTATTTRTSANVQGSHALQPAVATSSGISIQTMAPLDTDTAGAGSGNSPSYGAIAGIACGVGAALALTAAAFWYFWSRKRSRREEEREKHRSVANAPPPSADRHGVDDTPQSDGTIAKDSSAIRPMSVNAYDSIKRFTDDFGSPLSAPAYSANDANGYTVTNPDLNPTPPTESSNHDFSTCHASAVEAPSDWPLKLDSPPASAHVSNHTPPSWTNSQYASLLAAHTPYTPSRYHASAPNSIAKPFLQPPSLPQAYSAATFASDASRAPAGQYTPSNYQPGAPESVARAAPPSVPQEYSTATLSPDDIDGSPVYRGLRSSSSNAFPPYAYLSPEDALAGGWRNESPPRSEH